MKLGKPRDISLPTGVLGLAASPDGARLYAACMDGQIFEVDAASGAAEALIGKHTSYASGCVLLPDGKTLISGGYDGALLWHDIETKRPSRRVVAHDFPSFMRAPPGSAPRDLPRDGTWACPAARIPHTDRCRAR